MRVFVSRALRKAASVDVAGVGEEQAVVEAIHDDARRDRRVGVTFPCARGEA
jgi:hypothetical protein